jgi:two-component system, NarL family, sensor kinase
MGEPTHDVAVLDRRAGELATAREEERRRLRRDLHDGLGSAIAGVALGLDTACAMSAGHRELEELLSRLKAESQRAVTDIRRILHGLRPSALDELGLAQALREEAARLERQAPGLSITVHLPGLDGLPSAVEVAAYRIVTEALTNVLRHARARCCDVWSQPGQHLTLTVCDDGAGLPEGWRAGVGITAMRERAAELGGELVIEPRLPHGTRIAARLPVRESP